MIDSKQKKIKYTELFYSFQGEALHTGRPTVWLRFFGCNLECRGFQQPNPLDESTYIPSIYSTIDIKSVKSLMELPVTNVGCDSGYSVSSKFKHLASTNTVEEVCDKLVDLLPNKLFYNNRSIHLAFTGGEPMLWQSSIIDVVNELIDRGNYPVNITVETNGTKPLSTELQEAINYWFSDFGIEWNWSISPKLHSVSGEENAINYEVISEYLNSAKGYLKFVLNNTDAAWKEVDTVVSTLELAWLDNIADVYIMPVGADIESQTGTINKDLGLIANKALIRGWSVSGRVHANIFGNAMAT